MQCDASFFAFDCHRKKKFLLFRVGKYNKQMVIVVVNVTLKLSQGVRTISCPVVKKLFIYNDNYSMASEG
jgi:hypothetical protein